jgi:hypothetical protein
LYGAGALPLASPVLFPGMNFASVPPPLDAEQGRHAAEVIRRALEGDATPAEFREAMAMLQLVTDHARWVSENGGTLAEDSVAFLHSFYNTLDERTFWVPGYIGDDDRNWGEERRELMLAAMGTGLLALSNPTLWSPSIRDRDPMDPDSRYHLPPSIVDLVGNPVAWRSGGSTGLTDLDNFKALGAMLGATDGDVQGGRDFSVQLTLRVTELAIESDMDAPGGDAWDVELTALQPLLEASTRNPEANYAILTGDYDRPPSDDEDADGYPFDVSPSRVLQVLYSYEWSDDGRTAAGLTDWIPGYSASADPHHRTMAGESAASLIGMVTSTEAGDYYGDRYNMWDYLMDTVNERNPEVAAGLGRVTTAYLDAFAANSPQGGGPTEWAGALSINDLDKSRFLDLVATNDDAINRVSVAAGAFKEATLQQALAQAWATGDWGAVQDVAAEAGNLDGLLAAARVNAYTVTSTQDFQDANAAWAEHMYFANLGKGAFTTAFGAAIGTPTANPMLVTWTNFGIGQLADQVVQHALPQPQAPAAAAESPANYIGADETIASYDYVRTLLRTGELSIEDVVAHEQAERLAHNNEQTYLTKQVAGAPGHPETVLKSLDELTTDEVDALESLAHAHGGTDSAHPYVDQYEGYEAFDSSEHDTQDEVEPYRRGNSAEPSDDEDD